MDLLDSIFATSYKSNVDNAKDSWVFANKKKEEKKKKSPEQRLKFKRVFKRKYLKH